VRRVIAVEASAAMLQAARKRLQHFDWVELRRGELESLPLDDGRVDAATMMLALHHVAEPPRALAEAARVVRPGGRIVVVDMLPHDRENYRATMGHVWLGFSEPQISDWLNDAGFGEVRVVALPPDSKVTGPALFVATGTK
jgi:ArsR family transcriptional regulator